MLEKNNEWLRRSWIFGGARSVGWLFGVAGGQIATNEESVVTGESQRSSGRIEADPIDGSVSCR